MTTATRTPLRGRVNWAGEADRLTKTTPVAEREAAAVRGVFRELLASGASADEVLLFVAASIQNRPGGSALVGPLMAGVARATMGLTHGTITISHVETFVDAMLSEIES